MKDNDDHKLSDDELESWLAGTDDVSAMHRRLDQESPPPELDARILARARQSVERKAGSTRDVFIRPYATAATVFLCLAITFLLINEPEVPTPADFRAAGGSLEESIPVTLPQAGPRAPVAEADDAASADVNTGAGGAGVANRQADTGTRAINRMEAERPESLVDLLDLVEQRRLSETAEATPAPQGRSPENDASPATITVRAPPVARASQTQPQANAAEGVTGLENSLEEIVLTGSRIEDAFGYRSDRQTWLAEIARLRAEGETGAAGEEADRFLERYPDADLEAELAALESP